MELAWSSKVSPAFAKRVLVLCERFSWKKETHANWLMACMAFETGETFRSDIKNAAGSGAVGLIQFMPDTAIGLGTTSPELARMTPVAQLLYVERYFYPYAKKISSLSDMYMAILLPKYVGASPEAVLFSGGISYRQNSGLDKDRDGKITKLEATQKVEAKLAKGLLPANAGTVA